MLSPQNETLGRFVDALGGPAAAASAMWPGVPRKLGYDRVFVWIARGRVPGPYIGDLVRAARSVGIRASDDDLLALAGPPLPPRRGAVTTPCRITQDQEPRAVPPGTLRRAVA
jgi:hypothetical protein